MQESICKPLYGLKPLFDHYRHFSQNLVIYSPEMDELIRSGHYDQARAQMLAGATGNADALAVILELRDWLRLKEYEKARKLLKQDADLAADYLNAEEVKTALEALESEDPARIQPYTADPLLGAEAHTALGLLSIRSGETENAKSQFEAALQLDQGHFRAKTNLGNILLEAGQTDAAIATYEEVLKLHPEYPMAHHNLGAAYRKKGNLSKSVAHVKKAQQLQMRAPTRPQRVGSNSSASNPLPRSSLLNGRWWIWLVLIVVAYLFINRQP